MHTRDKGAYGESLVAEYLERLGWRIVARNLHFRFGEVDVVALAEKKLVLVEVKVKAGGGFGRAVEMITPQKQRTLLRLAKLLQTKYNRPVRIDVVVIDYLGSSAPHLTHYPNAIGE